MDEKLKPEQLWAVLSRAAEESESAGRADECLGLLQQALRMAEMAFGKNDKAYAFTLIRLADACIELERFRDAEENYAAAISILKTCLGDMHLSVGITYRNLAGLYELLGRQEDAAAAARRAGEILNSRRELD
jgi:tetratricopeptide (TPR) repeat protein